MTKQHFEAVARAVARWSIGHDDRELDDLINELSAELTFVNPRFDPRRFREACRLWHDQIQLD